MTWLTVTLRLTIPTETSASSLMICQQRGQETSEPGRCGVPFTAARPPRTRATTRSSASVILKVEQMFEAAEKPKHRRRPLAREPGASRSPQELPG
jgi:hypothetical protein